MAHVLSLRGCIVAVAVRRRPLSSPSLEFLSKKAERKFYPTATEALWKKKKKIKIKRVRNCEKDTFFWRSCSVSPQPIESTLPGSAARQPLPGVTARRGISSHVLEAFPFAASERELL